VGRNTLGERGGTPKQGDGEKARRGDAPLKKDPLGRYGLLASSGNKSLGGADRRMTEYFGND